MTESGKDDQKRNRPKQSTIVTVSLGSLGGLVLLLLRFCSFEGLSELLTFVYQASWVALLIHLGCHLHEGYFRKLPQETAFELLFVIAWAIAAIVLGLTEDPELLILALVWLASAYVLFHLGADIEEAREHLFKSKKKRLRRASDVIRESGIWKRFRRRVLRVEDRRAHGVLEAFPETDNADGNLTRMFWTAICAMLALGFIAATAAVAEILVKSDKPPAGPEAREEGDDEQQEARVIEGGDCAGGRDPSGNVPGAIRRTLSLAWHDVNGLEPGLMEALDYDIGGCPGPARPIPELKGGWYAPGYCGGELIMLSIAFEGTDHPVVLLEQAADFALPIIQEERFTSAEDRFEVGEGDAYVIDSRNGSYVLIRDSASSGPVKGSGGEDGGCAEFVDEDVAYAIAGPGLLGLWRSVAAISPGGVYPIDVATDDPNTPRIALRSTATGILTTATCDAALLACEMRFDGQTHIGSPGSVITPADVRALAES